MRPVLLDTNAFAMALIGDSRMPGNARSCILSAPRVSLSAISFYEIGQKVRLGKWDAMRAYVSDLVNIAVADGYNLVSINPNHAVEAATLKWQNRDPFDRMIATVAKAEGMDLISSDSSFDELPELERVWN